MSNTSIAVISLLLCIAFTFALCMTRSLRHWTWFSFIPLLVLLISVRLKTLMAAARRWRRRAACKREDESNYDMFRPASDPARTLYDAFCAESENRAGRTFDAWHRAELEAVYNAACEYAREHKLLAPTFDDVCTAEKSAVGFAGYGAQWAYRVSDILHDKNDNCLCLIGGGATKGEDLDNE